MDPDPVCGIAEPFLDMLGIDLKKFKPSFGGQNSGGLSGKEGSKESTESPLPRKDDDSSKEEDDGLDESPPKTMDDQVKEEDSEGSIGDPNVENASNDETENDVQQMLEDLEIPDFNLSVDFDSYRKEETNVKGGKVDYVKRMKREEIYSKRYHPSKGEQVELRELASKLGVSSSSFRLSSTADALHELLFGNHSIILKKGPISSKDQDCDMYILTDGFVLAYQSVSVFNAFGSRYETCHLWTDLEYVDLAKAGTLHLQMTSGESYELFAVSGGENVKSWCEAIENVALQQLMHDPNQSERTKVYGWQHTVIRRPGFTAAVMSDMKLMGNPRNLNELDVYNESAPLHYAMQHDPMDKEIVEALLRLGADPNVPDGEGRSAMYFAQRNELEDIGSILQEHGGKDSKLAEMELRGELFGGVEQANRKTEKRRENEKALEAAARAQSAQSQMSKNMVALIERGEKIQEMDSKARQLNDEAKTYGDLASQLKNNMKNKKWYQL
ncbi:ankyrin repeat domain protein [Nitzschia inconspicua]|uniref:Ankyrin repeat domain protein n=1 Tax=Nitzschia inconspicua TaxID=303405 RepID=A0A9K3LU49_9STRA|nr:ankyrin repeat domain protein [Nitzschia inconspicua]